ncbi:hypothetical protein J6590_007334 [Homalodisca vitripennis]|nr:hypothetical protein J6590_007334 [Homalodisca vitripennis]
MIVCCVVQHFDLTFGPEQSQCKGGIRTSCTFYRRLKMSRATNLPVPGRWLTHFGDCSHLISPTVGAVPCITRYYICKCLSSDVTLRVTNTALLLQSSRPVVNPLRGLFPPYLSNSWSCPLYNEILHLQMSE